MERYLLRINEELSPLRRLKCDATLINSSSILKLGLGDRYKRRLSSSYGLIGIRACNNKNRRIQRRSFRHENVSRTGAVIEEMVKQREYASKKKMNLK